MFYVELKTTAKKDLKQIDKQEVVRILKTIKKLENYPNVTNVKKLKNFTPTHRLRVGNYRVLFDVDLENQIIYVGEIKHRKEAY